MSDAPAPRRGNGFTAIVAKFKTFMAEMERYMKDEDGDGMPDGEMPETPAEMEKKHEGMSVTAPAKRAGVTETPAAGTAAGEKHMAEENKQPPPPAPEQMVSAVSAEEFAAVKAQLAAEQKERQAMAEKFAAAERARRAGEWKVKIDAFTAVPAEGLLDKFMALEDASPDLAQFFTNLIAGLDTQVATGNLFAQRGTGRRATTVETLADLATTILADKFDGDMQKWSNALSLAGKQRPDLLADYLNAAPAATGKE